jgi:hypothetical protein
LSTTVDGDKYRPHAHVCVTCDCLIIGMEKVEMIEKTAIADKFIQTEGIIL